jgi:hypothetical protein
MYERRHDPLISWRAFVFRLLRHAFYAGTIATFALLLGVIGYRTTEHMPWLDALLNASMILGGMGPVDPLHTTPGKLFASFYALLSGLLFITTTGILVAPAVHRLLHRFHWDKPG